MRIHSLWMGRIGNIRWAGLSLIVVGCSAGAGTPSEHESTSSSTPSALSTPHERSARHLPHMKRIAPLAHGAHNPLLQRGGDPGDDDTAISLDPALSALCQSYIGRLDLYGNPAPNVDAIHGDAIVTSGSQAGCTTAQNETTIAVNPHNPRNLVAGANDYRLYSARESRNDGSGVAYTSFNGGRTWTNTVLPHLIFQTGATGALSDMDSAGDPVVAFGPHNTVYYANLVFSRLNSASGIVVSVSRDGGATWGDPSIVHTDGVDATGTPLPTPIFNDKEWITVDPHTGAVYVSWTQFGATDSPIVVASSHDLGATWSAPVRVNPAFVPGGITAYSQGSSPQVARDGTLYIAYESAVCATLNCDQPTDMDAVIVATSKDGGLTFSNVVVGQNFDFPNNADVGRSTLTGENFRISSFPALAIDHHTGQLFVSWADDRDGQYDVAGNSIKTNGNVIVAQSNDGATWSAPVTLGTDADEVFPAIAANHGKVVVSFYTRKYDAAGIGLDYASLSGEALDALATKKLHRLTTETANPQVQFVSAGAVTKKVLQGVFIGDYTSIALGRDGIFHPAWTDFRGNPGVTPPNQDLYTQAVSIEECDDE